MVTNFEMSPVFKCRNVNSLQSRWHSFSFPFNDGEGGWNLVCRETNFWHLKKGREGWGTGRGIYTSIMQHIFIKF